MRLFYFLVVAASLTACATPDAEQATPPAAVHHRPRPREAPATVVSSATVVPVAPSHPGPPLRVRHHSPRAHSLPAPPPRPTTYADATRPAPNETDTIAIGNVKAAQRFWLQPGRDTVLYGVEGTVISVPAQAFVEALPGATALAGPVELQLKEFYSLPDILLNNLSTNSSQGLLETGGMLHLAAVSANGKPCSLRAGTELLVQMPASHPKANMQLYTGVHTAGHRLDWQRPRPALQPAAFDQTGPQVRGTEAQLRAFLRQYLAFSASTAQRLRATHTRPQRKALRQASRFTGTRWVEYGRLSVSVDRQGTVVGATADGIQDSVLRERLCGAARQLPAFRPAILSGPVSARPTAAPPRSYLTISRRKRRLEPTKPLPQLPVAGEWNVEIGFSRDGKVWFPWPSTAYAAIPGAFPNRRTFRFDNARQYLRRADTRTLQAASLDSLSGYLFSATSLGWANCDRTGQLASQRVYYGVETDAPNTRVQLVFRRARVVIPSDGERPGTRLQQFHSAPVGEAATLVAIKREGGVTYLAVKDVVMSEHTERNLPFRPVSADELRSALAKIDH
jgi:hypothetical protein